MLVYSISAVGGKEEFERTEEQVRTDDRTPSLQNYYRLFYLKGINSKQTKRWVVVIFWGVERGVLSSSAGLELQTLTPL